MQSRQVGVGVVGVVVGVVAGVGVGVVEYLGSKGEFVSADVALDVEVGAQPIGAGGRQRLADFVWLL